MLASDITSNMLEHKSYTIAQHGLLVFLLAEGLCTIVAMVSARAAKSSGRRSEEPGAICQHISGKLRRLINQIQEDLPVECDRNDAGPSRPWRAAVATEPHL
jgi:hypothetical protein